MSVIARAPEAGVSCCFLVPDLRVIVTGAVLPVVARVALGLRLWVELPRRLDKVEINAKCLRAKGIQVMRSRFSPFLLTGLVFSIGLLAAHSELASQPLLSAERGGSQALRIDFGPSDTVAVSPLGPTSAALLLGRARYFNGSLFVNRPVAEVLRSPDPSGRVEYEFGMNVPATSLWVAVDLETGAASELLGGGAGTFETQVPPDAIREESGKRSLLYFPLGTATFWLVRTGGELQNAGIWMASVFDADPLDVDGTANAQVLVRLADMEPFQGFGVDPPTEVLPGDWVTVISDRDQTYYAFRVTVSQPGTEPEDTLRVMARAEPGLHNSINDAVRAFGGYTIYSQRRGEELLLRVPADSFGSLRTMALREPAFYSLRVDDFNCNPFAEACRPIAVGLSAEPSASATVAELEEVLRSLGGERVGGHFALREDEIQNFAHSSRVDGASIHILGNDPDAGSDYLGLGVGHRFTATATWSTADGRSDSARPREQSVASGSMYFFGSDNSELFIKVLNGCGLNGHRWVFISGLTDVGVDLVVRDRLQGLERRYTSPIGEAFQPRFDTVAFPCSG